MRASAISKLLSQAFLRFSCGPFANEAVVSCEIRSQYFIVAAASENAHRLLSRSLSLFGFCLGKGWKWLGEQISTLLILPGEANFASRKQTVGENNRRALAVDGFQLNLLALLQMKERNAEGMWRLRLSQPQMEIHNNFPADSLCHAWALSAKNCQISALTAS